MLNGDRVEYVEVAELREETQ